MASYSLEDWVPDLKTYFPKDDAPHVRPHQQSSSLTESAIEYESHNEMQVLRSELEARDLQMIASLNMTIEKSLKTAAVYFLECQDAYQQGRKIPSPHIAPESSSEKEAPTKTTTDQLYLRASPNYPPGLSLQTMKDPDHETKSCLKSRKAATSAKITQKVAAVENGKCNDHKGFDLNSIKHFSGVYDAEKDHSWYVRAFERKIHEKVPVRWLFEKMSLQSFLPTHRPDSQLVKIVEAAWFENICCLVVLMSTIFAGIQIRIVIGNKFESRTGSKSFALVDTGFAVFFAVEMFLRIAALRGWFFVARRNWRSNLFDLFVVVTDLFIVFIEHMNMGIVRTLRIFRILRMTRLLRFIRAFRELRKFLTAVASCMTSLIWAGCFLCLVMFIFSLFIMVAIDSNFDAKKSDPITLEEMKHRFNGFGPCFRTLFEVIVGTDWEPPHDILCELSEMYSVIMPAFVFFTNIGVINILVGVFGVAAEDGADFHSIAQAEIADVEDFVGDMLLLYRDFVGARSDWRDIPIDKDKFLEYFHDEEVQAYMFHHHLDVRHAQMCWQFCKPASGEHVGVREFVLGLLRLKGMSSKLESQVLMHSMFDVGDLVTSLQVDGQ